MRTTIWTTLLALLLVACSSADTDTQTLDAEAVSAGAISQSDAMSGLSLQAEDYRSYLDGRSVAELAFLAKRPENQMDLVLDYHSNVVLAEHARELKLDESPRVRELMAQAERKVLLAALAEHTRQQVRMPDDAQLDVLARDQYERGSEKYVRPERRKVAHILINKNSCTLEGQTPQQLAAEIKEQLEDGASFEALVREHSADIQTRDKGGKIPTPIQEDGKTVRAFEEAVFAMQVGEVSEPVGTPFGIHLIKLLEVLPAEPIPYAELEQTLIQQERQRVVNSALEEMRAEAYPDPEAVDLDALTQVIEGLVEVKRAAIIGQSADEQPPPAQEVEADANNAVQADDNGQ